MKAGEPIESERKCGSCTKCCEGWLHGEIYGHVMTRGFPCKFKDKGCCSIYSQRPKDPCVSYSCAWLIDNNIPRWLKPDLCGVILTWKEVSGILYLKATETDTKMDSSVLSWMFMEHLSNKTNISYSINGSKINIGAPEFLKAMNKRIHNEKGDDV